jgi:hypothetical protein
VLATCPNILVQRALLANNSVHASVLAEEAQDQRLVAGWVHSLDHRTSVAFSPGQSWARDQRHRRCQNTPPLSISTIGSIILNRARYSSIAILQVGQVP